MSFRAMLWAWEVDGLTTTTKMVLLSLAQHANEDGAHSFPSVATIAAESRLSERAVQNALKVLEAEGYITVVRRLRQSSLFALRMDLHVVARRDRAARVKGASAAGLEGAPDSPSKGARDSPKGAPGAFEGAPRAPEPVLEPIQEPVDARASEAPPPGFEFGLFGDLVPIAEEPSVARPAPHAAQPRPALPVRDTPQQSAPPGYKLPHNPFPRFLNYAPIPPEPAGDPKRWMPKLSDPEHRWACLAPGEEIDPKSMNCARKQMRGGWFLRDIAGLVADALGWHDLTRYTDWRPLCAWLDDGIDPIDTILPTIRRVVERRGNLEISTLAYFDRAVREAAAGGNRRRTG